MLHFAARLRLSVAPLGLDSATRPKIRGVQFTSVLNNDAPVLHIEIVLLAKDAIKTPVLKKISYFSNITSTYDMEIK